MIKIQGTEWVCNNQCKKNCCSELFLPMPPAYKKMFVESGYWIANNNYTDYTWLAYHKAIITEKLPNGDRKIFLAKDVEYRIVFNPHKGYEEIYVQNKCSMLLDNNKCKVYRARPQICRKALCPVFDIRKSIQFYAENGNILKDKIEAYKRGELKKW